MSLIPNPGTGWGLDGLLKRGATVRYSSECDAADIIPWTCRFAHYNCQVLLVCIYVYRKHLLLQAIRVTCTSQTEM